jgi:hypothetical protein
VHVQIEQDVLEVRLAVWEKVLGLMGNIRVPLGDVSDVRFVENPLRETMRSGTLKVGLRLPWVIYVARSIRLDRAFVVRRGVSGLSFEIANRGTLKRVLVSAPQAGELVARLGSSD